MIRRLCASVFLLMLLIIGTVQAGEKATDLMSLALKNKAAGKTGLAIEQLQQAIENSRSALQKNLARFMLGDCQLESGRYTQAAKTFDELRNSVNGSEEKAEATYRLLQAETFLKNKKKAARLFSEIKKNYRSSPYYELASAFVSAQNLVPASESIQADKAVNKTEPEEKKVAAVKATPVVTKAPEKKEQPTKVATKPEPVAPAPVKAEKSARKVSGATADLLTEALAVSLAANKDEIVSEVLQLQDQLKNAGSDKDKVLFELAGKTLEFGETLEACKLYDQILNQHPTSAYVERAYYESIRLRAILGVHEAVVSWAKAFLATFPASQYNPQVKALLLYSENNGQINYSSGSARPTANSRTVSSPGQSDDSERLKQDSNYQQASRKMKDGKYNLALIDLKNLAQQYPSASQIWWDLALVYVQFEDFPKAENAIKKMLAITPDNEEGNSLLGYIHYRLEDYQQAASAYDRAGEAGGSGVNFFDPKKAAERMKKSVDTGK